MQLEFDFSDEACGKIVPFPLARTAWVHMVAFRYATIEDEAKRQSYWHDLLEPLTARRMAQGLRQDQIRGDIFEFGHAVAHHAALIRSADVISITGQHLSSDNSAAARHEAVGAA